MKITTARVYTYTIYGAALMGDNGKVAAASGRITLMSLSKARIKSTGHSFENDPAPDLATRIFRMAGFDHRITLDSATPLWLTEKPDPDTLAIVGRPIGLHGEVISIGADVIARVEHMPIEMVQHLMDASPGVALVEERDAKDVIISTMECAKALAEEDSKHGLLDSTVVADLSEMMSESAKMQARLDELDKPAPGSFMEFAKSQGSAYEGVLDGSDLRYVVATATDFQNVYVPAPMNGTAVLAPALRMLHIEPPTWHEPSDKMKASGVIGYWQFPSAAVGESMQQNGEQMVGFSVVNDFKVLVRSQDAISPAGQLAIPLPVWQRIARTENVPEHTMSVDEGDAFNKAHCVPTHARAVAESGRAN